MYYFVYNRLQGVITIKNLSLSLLIFLTVTLACGVCIYSENRFLQDYTNSLTPLNSSITDTDLQLTKSDVFDIKKEYYDYNIQFHQNESSQNQIMFLTISGEVLHSSQEDLVIETYEIFDVEPIDLNEIDIYSNEFVMLNTYQKLEVLERVFTHGYYWNTIGADTQNLSDQDMTTYISSTPCSHTYNGFHYCQRYTAETSRFFSFSENMQCLAFASLISDLLFGINAPMYQSYDIDSVKIGDHVRLLWSEHSFIVTQINGDVFTVAEVNRDYENCQISWGRTVSKSEIINNGYFILTRDVSSL